MQDRQEQIKKWINENPLRKYRNAVGLTIFGAAGALGVTMTAIQCWEQGINHPIPENMARIEYMIGVDKLSEIWTDWESKRPAGAWPRGDARND